MEYIERKIETSLRHYLSIGKSILLLGPRQTGKTTLTERVGADKIISLVDLRNRLRYSKDLTLLALEIEQLAREKNEKPLVVVDEIQKVPLLMDAIQDLIDRKVAQFIITGSSARQLKRKGQVNLLPGRVISLHLDPLTLDEMPGSFFQLNELLFYGSLPEVMLLSRNEDKEALLDSYVNAYLEEEVMAEALVRDLGLFARFLELAAAESGYMVNFKKLSQEIGVAHSTITNYYDILEDCLIAERIEPLLHSKTRRHLSKAQKYLFFDMGVRRLAAGEGTRPPKIFFGHLFEQFVGLQLVRTARLRVQKTRIRYWRDPNGPEVDWIVESEGTYIPIEVKYTDAPHPRDIKHLSTFLKEYPEAELGYVICQTPNRMHLSKGITAIPWQEMGSIYDVSST